MGATAGIIYAKFGICSGLLLRKSSGERSPILYLDASGISASLDWPRASLSGIFLAGPLCRRRDKFRTTWLEDKGTLRGGAAGRGGLLRFSAPDRERGSNVPLDGAITNR